MGATAGSLRLLDDLPVAVAVVDREGLIRYANPAAAERYGWRSAETGLGLSAAVLGEGLVERLAGGGHWRGELPSTGEAGETFLAAFEVAPFVDEHGEVAGSYVVCLDASRRADAERVAERLARLQVVTARMGAARDVDEVAASVCDHAAAGIGAHSTAFLQLVDDGETFELVRHVGLGAEIAARFARFPAAAALPAGDAVRSGGIVVVGGQELDGHTYAVVPLLMDDRPLGAVSFGFRRRRVLDDADRRFVLAVASQAAQAMRRIRNEEQERAARRRQELLARATGVLAGALDPAAAVTAVGRLAVQEFADVFSVHLLDDDVLRPAAVVAGDAELEEHLGKLAAGEAGRRLAAYLDGLAGRGRSVLVPELRPSSWDEYLDDPATADAVRELELSSAIVVGLRSGGRRLGVLTAARRGDRPGFDQDAFVLVAELAGRLAAAVDGALAHQARAEVARTLQASLLPPRLPEIPGVRVASRYDPIGDGSLVGGDFYDVFPVGDDRWCVVLGDVCGQGVPAASLTSLVRYTARAAARMWRSPAEILRFTNDAILDQDTGERFCTLLVAILRPSDASTAVTLAAGGHHLPLLRRTDGTVTPVGRVGTAMGLVREPDVADVQLRLAVGDVLVLTTDGVVEARTPDGEVVEDDFLVGLVERHGESGAEALAGAIERAVLDVGGGRAGDDVAVLVVECTGSADEAPRDAAPGGPFDHRYPADLASVTDARRAVAAWLEQQHLRPARVPDLLLAVTELVTNAVRAARTAVEVRCWLGPDTIAVEVTDDGQGFDPSIPRSPRDIDPLAERGRGLFLVAALVDECTIESGPNGTIVRCYVAR